jgi:hypothetical protein
MKETKALWWQDAQLSLTHAHPDDVSIMESLFGLAVEVAGQFRMGLKVVEHKRRPLPGGATGLCYQFDGRISVLVRYRSLAQDGGQWHKRRQSPDEIFNTTIHEVAHLYKVTGEQGLKDGHNHRELQGQMTAWALSQGLTL